MMVWKRHRVAVLGMGISVLLHILLFAGAYLWIPKPEKRTFRVQFVQRVVIPSVFRPSNLKPVGPEVKMERLSRQGGPADVPEITLPHPALTPETADHALPGEPITGWDKGKRPARVAPEHPSLDGKALEYIEQRERYRWRPFVSADTSDAESVRRRMAQQIIDRAIEALGGLQALAGIRDKVVTHRIEKHPTEPLNHRTTTTYHRRMRYLALPYPGIRIGYDGKRAWRDWYGLVTPAWGLQRKAERWDFLSRFRGDGVELIYVGQRFFEGKHVHEIELKDLKYGLKETAFFDTQTSLPAGMKTTAINLPINICSFGGPVAVVYGDYISIDGVMTAARTEQYIPDSRRPLRHIISQRTRYNDGLDDAIFQRPDGRLKGRPDLVTAANHLVSEEALPRSQYSLGVRFEIVPELRPPLCGRYRKPCITPLEKSLIHQTIIRTFAASKLFQPVILLNEFWLVHSDLDIDVSYVLLCRIVDGEAVSSRAWVELEVDLCTQTGDMLWKSSRARVDFQIGPISLISDGSAASIAGTIFNTLGGAFGTGLISLVDRFAP